MTRPALNRAPASLAGHWLPALPHWPRALLACLQQERAVIRVLVTQLRGSGPREPGACMLVTRAGQIGTIGGGRLEWQALQQARALLQDSHAAAGRWLQLVLGRELGQCCGGVVELWLERYTRAELPLLEALIAPPDPQRWRLLTLMDREGRISRRLVMAPAAERALRCRRFSPAPVTAARIGHAMAPFEAQPTPAADRLRYPHLQRYPDGSITVLEPLEPKATPLYLYGAGHVGQALVRVLAELPFAITWIDSRPELLPADLPVTVTPWPCAQPLEVVPTAPAGARHIVLTHDHALDYALCRAILQRGEYGWLGVIGSASKAARFRSRLARDGCSAAQIATLVCPLGLGGIAAKQPMAIAVSIAAQLLQDLPPAPAVPPADLPDCTQEACSTCRHP